jgi:hypothetical protein
VWKDDECRTTVKGNDSSGWSSYGVMFWLGRRQNGDAIEWWWEWSRLRWSFYSSGGWESDDLGRVSCCGDVNSVLWFRLERECDGMKHCQKMKRRQWARFGSIGRKRGMVWRCGDVGRRRGGTGGGKGRRRRQLGWCKSYWAKKWRKFTITIQRLQMDGEDLKQWWVNLFFLNICKWDLVLFISSHRTQWWKRNFKWISYESDKSF